MDLKHDVLAAKDSWHGFAFIAIDVSLVTASELLLKMGATKSAPVESALGWLGINSLGSPYVWLGILCLIIGFYFWARALRTIPLAVAFPFSNAVHVSVPLAAWMLLGEKIGSLRWGGILLVVLGLILIAKSSAARNVG